MYDFFVKKVFQNNSKWLIALASYRNIGVDITCVRSAILKYFEKLFKQKNLIFISTKYIEF